MFTPRPNPTCRLPRGKRAGFTLIEILIVVVILGILGAIVVPQFSNASHVARENTLKDDLRYLRTQIIVYKAEHKDLAPGYQNGVLSGSPGPTFLNQMTQPTDVTGNTGAASTVFCFGPYLQRMPPNPLTSDDTIKIVNSSPPVPDDSTGWLYNPATQEIMANSTMRDADGTPYAQY